MALKLDISNVAPAGEKIEYSPEMVKEYIRCREDIIYFAEKYFYIIYQDKGKRLVKLVEHQKRMLKAYIKPPEGKRHIIVLSARQSYKTTTNNISALHYALFNEDKEIAILANKERTAIKILKRLKTAYENLPPFLKLGVVGGGWNKKTIQFENGTSISASATSATAIRSDSVSCVSKNTMITIKNKITGEIREIPISDLMKSEYK
jgi:hypothetical protein